jgi:hypothetical protein
MFHCRDDAHASGTIGFLCGVREPDCMKSVGCRMSLPSDVPAIPIELSVKG